MSWDGYITNLLANGVLEHAAIGTPESIWAKDDSFQIKPEDIKKLIGDRQSLYQSGVHIGNQKFHILRHNFEDESDPYINLKSSKVEGAPSCNATVYKTRTAYVVGVGKGESQGGSVTTEVCKIGAYLKGQNY